MKNKKIPLKKQSVLLNKSVFLARVAELLKEGYTFFDALNLVLPHHMTEYKSTLSEVDADFRKGLGVSDILGRFGFSSSALLPVSIAEKNGHLSEVLEGTAKRLRKIEEVEKRLRSLLAYPIVLFVFVMILLIAFRNFFLPNMAALAESRQDGGKELVSLLPMIVSRIPDMIFALGIAIILMIACCIFVYKRLVPAKKIQFFSKLPIAGKVFFMWKTQVFASEMGNLLQSGISMQDALDVLIRQKLDPILGEIAKDIKEYVMYGESFHEAIRLTEGLTKECSSFAEHGAISGHLSKELLIYSVHLEEAIHLKFTKGLALLQPLLFGLIAICILAAYIALLLPVYGMLDKI